MADALKQSAEVSDSLATDASISSEILSQLVDHISSAQELQANNKTTLTTEQNNDKDKQCVLLAQVLPPLDSSSINNEISEMNMISSNQNPEPPEAAIFEAIKRAEQSVQIETLDNVKSKELGKEENNLEDVIMLDDDSPTQSSNYNRPGRSFLFVFF